MKIDPGAVRYHPNPPQLCAVKKHVWDSFEMAPVSEPAVAEAALSFGGKRRILAGQGAAGVERENPPIEGIDAVIGGC